MVTFRFTLRLNCFESSLMFWATSFFADLDRWCVRRTETALGVKNPLAPSGPETAIGMVQTSCLRVTYPDHLLSGAGRRVPRNTDYSSATLLPCYVQGLRPSLGPGDNPSLILEKLVVECADPDAMQGPNSITVRDRASPNRRNYGIGWSKSVDTIPEFLDHSLLTRR